MTGSHPKSAVPAARRRSKSGLLVTVDTRGRVISAQPVDVYGGTDPAPGMAGVKRWTFRPQQFEGKPVIAIGRVSIEYRYPERPADTRAVFPPVDLAQTEITLERGACFGTCPDYRVTVTGSGTVSFQTDAGSFADEAAAVHLAYNGNNVLLPGNHVAKIDPAKVARLVESFRAAHFFGLKNDYSAFVTDNPTTDPTPRWRREDRQRLRRDIRRHAASGARSRGCGGRYRWHRQMGRG